MKTSAWLLVYFTFFWAFFLDFIESKPFSYRHFRLFQPALISRRRQLVEMRTAEKNRRERACGKALADIEAHLEYLDNCLEKLNQEIEELTQANQQWPEKVK